MKRSIFLISGLIVCLTLTCGEAKRCQIVCPFVYIPVCGISKLGTKRTFFSQCEMETYNCENPNNQYSWTSNKACS